MATPKYQQGETAILTCSSVSNTTDAAANPSVAIVVYIKDPADTVQVSGSAATTGDTGSHTYLYNIAADAEVGVWRVEWKTTDGSPVETTIEQDTFIVEPRTTA